MEGSGDFNVHPFVLLDFKLCTCTAYIKKVTFQKE